MALLKHFPFYFVIFAKELIVCTWLKQVKNFIALAGPHAGIASPPLCNVYAPLLFRIITLLCFTLSITKIITKIKSLNTTNIPGVQEFVICNMSWTSTFMQVTQTCILQASLINLGVYTKFVQVPKSPLFTV